MNVSNNYAEKGCSETLHINVFQFNFWETHSRCSFEVDADGVCTADWTLDLPCGPLAPWSTIYNARYHVPRVTVSKYCGITTDAAFIAVYCYYYYQQFIIISAKEVAEVM